MPKGKTHNTINMVILPVFIAIMICYMDKSYIAILAFISAYLFSTFLFSPDTDLKPTKRLSLFGVFFYPYTQLFKHRSAWSHGLIFSTVVRICYLACVILFIMFIVCYLLPNGDFKETFNQVLVYLKNSKEVLIFAGCGYAVADSIHIVLDRLV